MNIVIVDDKIENLYLLEALLKGYGHNVYSAKNGAEALGIMHKNKPELIISDILMPVMDGYSLCIECKKNDNLKNIPFIFYTATYTDPKDEEFALNLGADKFLLKPIDPDILIDEIENIKQNFYEKENFINNDNEIDEKIVLKEYNEALIRKLEDKMADSERSEKELIMKNIALEKEIEERKRAEKIINEYSANLDSLINNRNELIWSINKNYEFIIINNLYKEFCKEIYNSEIYEGINALQIFYSKDRMFWENNYNNTLTGKRIWFEFIVQKAEKSVYYEVFLNPIYSGEKVVGLSAISYDITERKRAEMELKAAKEKAEEMNRLKSNFLANMSHELRTPLMGILGYADLLNDEIQKPEHKKMIKDILSSGKRLSETLQLILDLANTESNQIKKVEKLIDVNKIIKDCIKRYDNLAQKKNLQINYTEKSIMAYIDARLLSRIVDNLLNNALKYTNIGHIDVEIDDEIIVGVKHLFIKITDTGIGISKKDQAIIFEEFRQASEGWSRNFEGTGLGLTIAKKMTEIMGGLITVESEVGKGSTFIVKIPVFESNSESHNTSENISFEHKPNVSKRILYVEDEEINRSLIKAYLNKHYELDTVASGIEAFDFTNKINYDLIMMDINLGTGITGLEVVKKLRERDSYANTPIIAVTAYTMAGDKEKFLSNGCTHYLAKPFTRALLLKMLENIFSEKSKE